MGIIKREKYTYPIEWDVKVLKEILQGAVLRENYELAAIIKKALDQINSEYSPAQQPLQDKIDRE